MGIFKDTKNKYCLDFNIGFKIENITQTLEWTSMNEPKAQILTDMIFCDGKVLVTSKSHQVLLKPEQIMPLIKDMGIPTNLTTAKMLTHNYI